MNAEQNNFDFENGLRPKFKENTVFHVGVSGGKDSAAALIWMVRESGIDPSKIQATFCDTGNEHEWTLEHVELLSKVVHPVATIHPDLKFYELASQKKRFPSAKARFCTEYLKIIPSAEHIHKLRQSGLDPIAVSGVRSDESEDRKNQLMWDYSGTMLCMQWRPLIHWKLEDVLDLHKKHSIPLNPLYGVGAKRVGCFPCMMSRKAEIRMIALKFPERIVMIRNKEQELESLIGRYPSFFPADTVPLRFRSKDYVNKKGEHFKVATIDDVVRWSMTGKRAKGHWTDDEELEHVTCKSGYCE